ncbi:hypothetical protein [Roseibium algae]|uniref:Uncharacterized protein n=1 Tax=Roseibium algae TaxID=3123038 RepID=A0ABU8TR64_9HYPH
MKDENSSRQSCISWPRVSVGAIASFVPCKDPGQHCDAVMKQHHKLKALKMEFWFFVEMILLAVSVFGRSSIDDMCRRY